MKKELSKGLTSNPRQVQALFLYVYVHKKRRGIEPGRPSLRNDPHINEISLIISYHNC